MSWTWFTRLNNGREIKSLLIAAQNNAKMNNYIKTKTDERELDYTAKKKHAQTHVHMHKI